MLSFWLVVAAMIVLPLFILLRSLLFTRSEKHSGNEHIDVAIYKARTAELEDEVESGILMEEKLSEVREDLKRTLLHDIDSQSDNNLEATQISKRDWWTAGVVTILLPITAIFIYLALGTPGPDKQPSIHSTSENSEAVLSVEEMVAGLASRLQKEPDDQQGWIMLARSYMVLGKYNEAVSAFERLNELAGAQPGILLGYANALALANNGRVTGKPEQLAQKVLEIEPGNSNGLWIVGMAAFEQGEFQLAINYWQQLLEQLVDDSTSYNEVAKLISRAEQQLSETGNQFETLISNQTSDDQVSKSISKSITVNVSLSSHLVQDTNPTDTLFIFARSIDGPRMPIAVVRKQMSDLPLTVVLDDSVSMMEQRRLSGFDEVIVSARISKTGDAIPKQGDLIGKEVTVDLLISDPVEIVIDQQVP